MRRADEASSGGAPSHITVGVCGRERVGYGFLFADRSERSDVSRRDSLSLAHERLASVVFDQPGGHLLGPFGCQGVAFGG